MRALVLIYAVVLSACASAVQQTPPPERSCVGASPSPVVQAFQVQFDAYNRRDLEAFLSVYAPGIRTYNLPDELLLEGLEQMRGAYGRLFTAAPNLHARMSNCMVQGNYIIAHEHVTGRPDGSAIDAIVIYEVRDGKIRNVWFVE